MTALKRRNVHATTIGIGSALHTGGRLQYVHRLRRAGEHTFALIAAAGHVPHREIRLDAWYSASPSLAILTQRFLEDEVHDGVIAFTREDWEFTTLGCDTLEGMADAMRKLGVAFAATGSEYASDPDGSTIVDYATAEREIVSVWPRGLRSHELAELIRLVDTP